MAKRISFRNPPVVETVLSAQFEPFTGFTNGHLGAFWKALGATWTKISDAKVLEQQFERFGEQRRWQQAGLLRLKLLEKGPTRLQIRNDHGDRMIQIQNGRIVYNWLGESGRRYDRYEEVKAGFDEILRLFSRFVSDEQLGELSWNQWEVTYVNHILCGTVWNSPADWNRVFAFEPCPTIRALQPETFGAEWHFDIPPERGRIHVELNHGRKGSATGPEMLILKLTARGPLTESTDTIDAGLDLGHDTIVNTFASLTSEDARRYWQEETG